VVQENKIIGIIRRKKESQIVYDWALVDNKLKIFLANVGNVCISSLADSNLKNFYEKYRNFVDISILSESNIDDFLRENMVYWYIHLICMVRI
jgi:hypothetical protein